MSSNIYFDNIEKYLFLYADLIHHANSLGLNDKTLHAENIFSEIFKQVFGWKLVNANEENKNQDSFDLIDKERGVCIQVTANKSVSAKYKKSVAMFKTKDYSDFKHFIIFFIKKKISAKIPEISRENGVMYEYYDLSKLLEKIFYRCTTPRQLCELNKLLEETVEPVRLTWPNLLKPVTPRVPRQHLPTTKKGIYIERADLLNRLHKFSQEDHGLLVGGPGFGKSFLLGELQRQYYSRNLTCYLVKINELTEGTDDEINRELKTTGNWIDALKIVKRPAKAYNLLIFDAYDTAKDEKLKANILKQIRRSLQELKEDWRILVSVRTYDATRSSTLQELFPHQNFNNAVHCRYLEIGELTDDELESALASEDLLHQIAQQSSASLRSMLKTPYFLKLFEQIIIDNDLHNGKMFLGIETEGQLLDIYWKHAVEDTIENELFIQKLTNILAKNENLVCLKTEIVDYNNHKCCEQLISRGIVIESSISRIKIGFTHNILLDYAIAKYLLEEDITAQIELLRAQEKMPFIFRQSFIYFYANLYKIANQLFWQHYRRLNRIDEPLFRLLHHTSLNYVLVTFYKDYHELLPVFDEPDPDKRGHAVRRLLEAVRFVTKGNIRVKDLWLLRYTAENLHWIFLWETGLLLEKAISQYVSKSDQQFNKMISDACCSYLDFLLNERQNVQLRRLVDHNGGIRGIDNFCKTFAYNKQRGKVLIKKLMTILREDDFPINFFLYLSDNMLELYTADRAVGSMVYQTLYSHSELSDKETTMGNSVVLPLRSNRKQDYGHVYYRLEKTYPELLKFDFLPAMRNGITIVNHYSDYRYKKRRILSVYKIKVGKIDAKIVSDYSLYDYENERGPFSHLEAILKMLEEQVAVPRNKSVVNHYIGELIKVARASRIWRGLLQLFTRHVQTFKQVSFRVLTNCQVYVCDGTVYESGELLRVLWPLLTTMQRLKLEKTIHEMTKDKELLKYQIANERIGRILGCIPPTDLRLDESKLFLASHKPQANHPTISRGPVMAKAHAVTRDERIGHAGFDPSSEEDISLYVQIEKLEKFNDVHQNNENKELTSLDYQDLIPTAQHLFAAAKSWPERKRYKAEYEVSRFVRILSSLAEKLTAEQKKIISEIALEYVQAEHYLNKEYEKGALTKTRPSFGPNAKTTAVQTVINMTCIVKSKRLENVMINLMSDNELIVRYKAAYGITYFWYHDRSRFWQILHDRIAKETDGMAFSELIRAVSYDDIISENQAEVKACAQEIMERIKDADDEVARDLWRMYVVLLLKLILRYDASFAVALITSNLSVKELSHSFVFESMKVVDPHSPENDYGREPNKFGLFFAIILKIIDYRFKELERKGLSDPTISEDFEIIDYITQRLHFTTITGTAENRGNVLASHKKASFYRKIKPILDKIVDRSSTLESGFMVAHTGYHFMQILNFFIDIDTEHILSLSNSLVLCAAKNGFTYDSSTLSEIVKLTERIIADHKEILNKDANFSNLVVILDQFSSSGWQEALELTWRLKEAF